VWLNELYTASITTQLRVYGTPHIHPTRKETELMPCKAIHGWSRSTTKDGGRASDPGVALFEKSSTSAYVIRA
jgi:hypothetical protein